MRTIVMPLAIAAGLLVAPSIMLGQQALSADEVAIGRGLQWDTSVKLAEPAPPEGLQVTLTSDDPKKLLLCTAQDKPGTATITMKIGGRNVQSPDFCLQGLGDSGKVTYTLSAPGIPPAKATVTLWPSAIVLIGPGKGPTFASTPGGAPSKLKLATVRLDAAKKVAGEQQVAGGTKVDVSLTDSDPKVGKLANTSLTIPGGDSVASTWFSPAGAGKTTVAVVQPSGFTTPAEMANVVADISLPGIAILGEAYLGKDLELGGILCLGEAAPPGGMKVTLKSNDGNKMVISDKADKLGGPVLTLEIPAGNTTANYFVQALGNSGEVTYTASATGYRTREARLGLTPSGVIVAYEAYGPPDEAAVRRSKGVNHDRSFTTSVARAKEKPVHMTVYTCYIHPDTQMCADITVQQLRPGADLTVNLQSTNPAVATVESPILIKPGKANTNSLFTPLTKGDTVITVSTPTGMTTPKNATSVPVTIYE